MDDETPIRLAVSDTGEGNTVVFTHGWIDDRTVWDATIAALGSGYHCVSWDLRGHGESEVPPAGSYTRQHALGDMERVVSDAGTPTILVGHSLGGYLSLAYTLLHPDQVSGLVLVAAGPGFRNPDARKQWNTSVNETAARLGVASGSEAISQHVDSWVIDSLSEIAVPTVVVIGEHDKRFQASAAVFEKALDVKANITVPDAGHGVHKKKPAEVASAIKLLG